MKSKNHEKLEKTELDITIRVRNVHLYRPEFLGKTGLQRRLSLQSCSTFEYTSAQELQFPIYSLEIITPQYVLPEPVSRIWKRRRRSKQDN
jgi:hypothetical protein